MGPVGLGTSADIGNVTAPGPAAPPTIDAMPCAIQRMGGAATVAYHACRAAAPSPARRTAKRRFAMIVTYLGMFFGLALGLIMAGPMGGVVGVVAGMSLGLLWSGAKDARAKVPLGADVVHENQSILCVPKGQVASVEFLRDESSGSWLDVERCSLCAPENEVACAKNCLLLIRDALPRREHTEPVAAGTTA